MNSLLIPVVALTTLTVAPFVHMSVGPRVPIPTAWVAETGPPPSCGRPLWIGAVMPWPDPDGDGEWLTVVNPGPGPISLRGWEIRAGRRRRRVPDIVLLAGGSLRLDAETLGTTRLRNHDGAVSVIDPCGDEGETATWAESERGVATTRAHGWDVIRPDG